MERLTLTSKNSWEMAAAFFFFSMEMSFAHLYMNLQGGDYVQHDNLERAPAGHSLAREVLVESSTFPVLKIELINL